MCTDFEKIRKDRSQEKTLSSGIYQTGSALHRKFELFYSVYAINFSHVM